MTELEKAWLAGLFDGEGCISIYKREENKGYRLEVSVVGTDLSIISSLVDLIGVGRYRTRPSRATKWRACGEYKVSGKSARPLLEAILPYTRIKTAEVELALELVACKYGERKPVYAKFRELRREQKQICS